MMRKFRCTFCMGTTIVEDPDSGHGRSPPIMVPCPRCAGTGVVEVDDVYEIKTLFRDTLLAAYDACGQESELIDASGLPESIRDAFNSKGIWFVTAGGTPQHKTYHVFGDDMLLIGCVSTRE